MLITKEGERETRMDSRRKRVDELLAVVRDQTYDKPAKNGHSESKERFLRQDKPLGDRHNDAHDKKEDPDADCSSYCRANCVSQRITCTE